MILLYFSFITCILLLCLRSGDCQLPGTETTLISPSECFGAGLSVNATCPLSKSIALGTISVGVQPSSQNCQSNQTAGDGSGCCDTTSGCEFDFPLTDNTLYHKQCNGRQSCMPGIQVVNVIHGQCNTTIYPQYTEYMFFNFYCIDDDRSIQMGGRSLNRENVPLYLESPGYPNDIQDSVSDGSCSVEIDNCGAAISVYIIDMNLANYTNSTLCKKMQSLSIIGPDGTLLVNWTCLDNTYTISQSFRSTDNYFTVNFTNMATAPEGRFWIGFEATIASNISIDCPAVERKNCLPTTSSTISTTSTTATTSTSTATTSASTTTYTTSVAITSTQSTTETTTSSTTSTPTTNVATTTPTTTSSTTELTTSPTPTSSPTPTTSPTSTASPTTTESPTSITSLDEAASTSSSTNITTVIIVVCSCLAAVLVVVLIIALVIWRKNRKRKSPERSNLIDKQDIPSIESGSSVSPTINETNSEIVYKHCTDIICRDVNEKSGENENKGNDGNASDEKEFIPSEFTQIEDKAKNDILVKSESTLDTEENQIKNEVVDKPKSIENMQAVLGPVKDEVNSKPLVVQPADELKTVDEEKNHSETTDNQDTFFKVSAENAQGENKIPQKHKDADKRYKTKKDNSHVQNVNTQRKKIREPLLDLDKIELATASSTTSGTEISSSQEQTTHSENFHVPVPEQDLDVSTKKKLNNRQHLQEVKTPDQIPIQRTPGHSKRPETPYERYYRHVARAFSGPEIFERRIINLIQERKDRRRKRRKRRRNNEIEPADPPVEQIAR